MLIQRPGVIYILPFQALLHPLSHLSIIRPVPEQPWAPCSCPEKPHPTKGSAVATQEEDASFTRAPAVAGWIIPGTSSSWDLPPRSQIRREVRFKKGMKAFELICSNYPADSSWEEEKIVRALLPQNSCN